MFDIGVTKLAIVGGIALIVIGPERLPRVARMVGTLLGRAQRYVADVKAEVNRSIEVEELSKMKSQFEGAARDVHDAVNRTMRDPGAFDEPGVSDMADAAAMRALPPPAYKAPRKNWRLKRAAMPTWYKKHNGVRTNAQSGAARVARFRPRPRSGGAL
ncbi:MAG: Sec-independent protein translocase protein TatB [Burkholderiaceae bacterium]